MTTKKRLTVTVDDVLVTEGQRAVEAGRADSVSGWVNAALVEKIERDRRLASLADAIAAYEAEFGEITTEEIEAQRRLDRERATVVRGSGRRRTTKSP